MSQATYLPSWTGAPPDPLSSPALFDGLLWRRPLAYLVDAVVIGFLLGGWLWLVVMSLGLLWSLTSMAFLVIPILYHASLVGGRHHATLGMRLLGLEVKTWDGGAPDFWQGLLMAVLFYVTVVATSLLILLVVLINDRRRTVHDYLSGVVVTRRAPALMRIRPAARA
ncbi:MAG TPA: RDD family protein [Dongiaceae bacterium]|nr:RDD family protein [Dongiaceae bacterium]